jgi:peptidoglycan/xylan/chitin deacetylase (PgdA/CDA1 family)
VSKHLVVKQVATAVDEVDLRLRTRPPGITVLSYHEVGGGTDSAVDLPVEVFDQQIAGLAEARSVVSLGRALHLLAAGEPLDRPLVVVTFDDGTPGFVDNAVPVLVRHRVPATIFLATQWIEEGTSPWPGTPLGWSALAEAVATGLVGIGSHSHGHLLFDREPARVLADDLDRSIGLIRDRLGCDPRDFAYPKALPPSREAAPLVAARFRSASLASGHANRPGRADPLRLARTPVQRADDLPRFRRKVAGGMVAEARIRRLGDHVRYRNARS